MRFFIGWVITVYILLGLFLLFWNGMLGSAFLFLLFIGLIVAAIFGIGAIHFYLSKRFFKEETLVPKLIGVIALLTSFFVTLIFYTLLVPEEYRHDGIQMILAGLLFPVFWLAVFRAKNYIQEKIPSIKAFLLQKISLGKELIINKYSEIKNKRIDKAE